MVVKAEARHLPSAISFERNRANEARRLSASGSFSTLELRKLEAEGLSRRWHRTHIEREAGHYCS